MFPEAGSSDEEFMRRALHYAREAAAAGEVPVGAIAVCDGEVVAAARNRVEEKHTVTAHAELELLHALETLSGDWRMEKYTFYVTKEPCAMCTGALINARVGRIVFGLPDMRCGCCGSAFDLTGHAGMLWRPQVTGWVLPEECRAVLRDFFRARRRNATPSGTILLQRKAGEAELRLHASEKK